MAEPTPGPWFVSEDPRPGMEWNTHIASDPAGENRVCFMANGGPEREEEFAANAFLIASAPELYEALAELVEEIETDGGVDTSEWPLLDAAKAALAKARGES